MGHVGAAASSNGHSVTKRLRSMERLERRTEQKRERKLALSLEGIWNDKSNEIGFVSFAVCSLLPVGLPG